MTCAGKAERKGPPLDVQRMMGLETSVKMLGTQQSLADALGIDVRSLRAKLTAERGVSDGDLAWTAAALDARAEHIRCHAAKLRALAAGEPIPSPSTTGATA